MCDYSLHSVQTRPAKVGDQLTIRDFGTGTRGFAAAEDSSVAVCLRPGTELSFQQNVSLGKFGAFFPKKRLASQTALFRQINVDCSHIHHDALEFPDGQVVLLTRLTEGQSATVLQLPADPLVAPAADRTLVTA
jgi:hypothetical protein